MKTHLSDLVEFNAVLRVHVSNKTARPNGAIDRVFRIANARCQLEGQSTDDIDDSFNIAPTKELENVLRLFLDEPGRETLGDELRD